MRDYFELIAELKEKGIEALDGDFYDYRGFPLEKEFQEFYEFCQTYLDRDDLAFNIKPARFYYNTNTDVNGLAYVKNGYNLVEIYKGTIFGLHSFFNEKEEKFKEKSLNDYKRIIAADDISCPHFLFQYVTLYFLYHEVAHLIQRSMGSNDQKEFADAKCEGEDIVTQHIKEHDADWFAANQIAFHLLPFAQKLSEKTGEKLENILQNITGLALAGIYMYFIKRAKGYQTIYYQEYCHPHPSIRLSYMIIYLLDALSANVGSTINKANILKSAIQISEVLMLEKDKNVVQEYSVQLYKEISRIELYIKKIREDAKDYPFTSQKALDKTSFS